MDDADRTADRMEAEEELRRRAPKKPELDPVGSCYYCGEDVAHPKKFCDSTCAEDFEFEKRMRRVGK